MSEIGSGTRKSIAGEWEGKDEDPGSTDRSSTSFSGITDPERTSSWACSHGELDRDTGEGVLVGLLTFFSNPGGVDPQARRASLRQPLCWLLHP